MQDVVEGQLCLYRVPLGSLCIVTRLEVFESHASDLGPPSLALRVLFPAREVRPRRDPDVQQTVVGIEQPIESGACHGHSLFPCNLIGNRDC